jgi:hypothetical protein
MAGGVGKPPWASGPLGLGGQAAPPRGPRRRGRSPGPARIGKPVEGEQGQAQGRSARRDAPSTRDLTSTRPPGARSLTVEPPPIRPATKISRASRAEASSVDWPSTRPIRKVFTLPDSFTVVPCRIAPMWYSPSGRSRRRSLPLRTSGSRVGGEGLTAGGGGDGSLFGASIFGSFFASAVLGGSFFGPGFPGGDGDFSGTGGAFSAAAARTGSEGGPACSRPGASRTGRPRRTPGPGGPCRQGATGASAVAARPQPPAADRQAERGRNRGGKRRRRDRSVCRPRRRREDNCTCGTGRQAWMRLRGCPQISSSSRSGLSTHSLTRTRKLTASRPSMRR